MDVGHVADPDLDVFAHPGAGICKKMELNSRSKKVGVRVIMGAK